MISFDLIWDQAPIGITLRVSNGMPEPALSNVPEWALWRSCNFQGQLIEKIQGSPRNLVIQCATTDAGTPIFQVSENAKVTYSVIAPPLAVAKFLKWEDTKQLRTQKEYSVVTVPTLGPVQIDLESRMRIRDLVDLAKDAAAAGTTFSEPFTLADNSVAVLSGVQTIQLGSWLASYVRQLYARARALRAQIYGSTTLAELDGVDITTGWP